MARVPPRFLVWTFATTDTPQPLYAGLGFDPDLMTEVLIQIATAAVAMGNKGAQPVVLSAGGVLTYDVFLSSEVWVKSNAAGVPGTVVVSGWSPGES